MVVENLLYSAIPFHMSFTAEFSIVAVYENVAVKAEREKQINELKRAKGTLEFGFESKSHARK